MTASDWMNVPEQVDAGLASLDDAYDQFRSHVGICFGRGIMRQQYIEFVLSERFKVPRTGRVDLVSGVGFGVFNPPDSSNPHAIAVPSLDSNNRPISDAMEPSVAIHRKSFLRGSHSLGI